MYFVKFYDFRVSLFFLLFWRRLRCRRIFWKDDIQKVDGIRRENIRKKNKYILGAFVW